MSALITRAQRERLLANGRRSQSEESFDPKPVVKLFTPDAQATWLLTEIDPDNPDIAFGLCDLGMGSPELGYVLLSEITGLRGQLGLPVERDRHFEAEASISAYADAACEAGHIVEQLERKGVMTEIDAVSQCIRHLLHTIAQNHASKLRAEVASAALESEYDDLSQWFSDLLQHGCASGMVPSLIYYTDTHSFFNRHYEEIEFLRQLYEDDLGEPLKVEHDLKNWFAWFAFEETARRIFDEINGEV